MTWIALTGVNGFIGHNLTLDVLQNSQISPEIKVEQVLGSDLPKSLERDTYRSNTEFVNFRFCLAENFVQELDSWSEQHQSPPLAVIHNGACSSTTETDPEVFRTLNLESSRQLFSYCAKRSVPFLYASSASVYGDGSLGFSDLIEKNGLYSPMNLYGQSKHTFDKWVLQQEQRPPTWFGLRYFNVFGPHEEHKLGQASILHWGGRQIRETGKLKLYRSHRDDIADGEQRRDFVSVFDVIRVTLGLLRLALKRPSLPEQGLFVNIGRGEAATWLETGAALFRAHGLEPAIEFIDMPDQLRHHYQNYTKADLSTLHQLGLREPFLDLEEGFRRALNGK